MSFNFINVFTELGLKTSNRLHPIIQGTHRYPAIGLRLSVGEVAHGPGQVVGGHARRPGEAIGQPAVFVRQRAALHRHVGERGVLSVMAEGERERGLVDGLVETREGLPGVDRTELGHCQVPERDNRKWTVSPDQSRTDSLDRSRTFKVKVKAKGFLAVHCGNINIQ